MTLKELRAACEVLRIQSAELCRRSAELDAQIIRLNARAVQAILKAKELGRE